MSQAALGEVRPPSTTVALRATHNQPDPAKRYPVFGIQFQALDNTGSVFIVTKEQPNLSQDVLAEIPAATLTPGGHRPLWSLANAAARNSFNVADFWILPSVAGEGVRVTVVL